MFIQEVATKFHDQWDILTRSALAAWRAPLRAGDQCVAGLQREADLEDPEEEHEQPSYLAGRWRQGGQLGTLVSRRDPVSRATVRDLFGRAAKGDGPVSSYRRWRDSGHLERAVETAGGAERFEDEVAQLRGEAQGWRLAEVRKRRGLTQTQVAERMGISIARVSQIEKGDVSTREVLDRYVAALGGTLRLVADFGDEQLKVS